MLRWQHGALVVEGHVHLPNLENVVGNSLGWQIGENVVPNGLHSGLNLANSTLSQLGSLRAQGDPSHSSFASSQNIEGLDCDVWHLRVNTPFDVGLSDVDFKSRDIT